MSFARALLLLAVAGAPRVAAAQDCAAMSLFHQGAHQVRTNYDAKGKETGHVSMDVAATAVATAGAATTATVHSVSTNAKGKEEGAVDYDVTCEAGEIRFDMRGMVSPDTEAYEDFEITMSGDQLAYPATLQAGQTLPDGTFTMTMTMPGAPAMIPPTVMTFQTRNRTVEAAESVTTPAGTFDTWKLRYDTSMVMKGMVANTTEAKTVEWYVPGTGSVKSEAWSGDKLVGTTVLTESR